jgi:hypothetical protein
VEAIEAKKDQVIDDIEKDVEKRKAELFLKL